MSKLTSCLIAICCILSITGCTFPWGGLFQENGDENTVNDIPQPGTKILLTVNYRALPQKGALTMPTLYGDAGNFAIQAGSIITITWKDAPVEAAYAVFILAYKKQYTVIGVDENLADGVAVEWLVPEHTTGEPLAVAYQTDGTPIARPQGYGDLYAGDAPPPDKCVVSSATIGAENIFASKQATEPIAILTPSVYATVIEHTNDGWVSVDLSNIQLVTDGSLGTGQIGWMNFAMRKDYLRFTGPCNEIIGSEGSN